MRSVNFIIVFICLFFSSNAISSNDMKLKGYHCPTAADAKSCSSRCIQKKDLHFEFKVNIKNSIVISNMYSNNELFHSVPLDNCKVVDNKNWICTIDTPPSVAQTNSMINGVFSFHTAYTTTGMCAK